MLTIEDLGVTQEVLAQAALEREQAPELKLCRVISTAHGVLALSGEYTGQARLAGRLRHELSPLERPTTGDWVLVRVVGEEAAVQGVLPRSSKLVRQAAGGRRNGQLIGANVDVFFITTSATEELNYRRLERYLAAVRDGGATPVVLLTKVDLAAQVEPLLQAIAEVAGGAHVLPLSAKMGQGVEALEALLVARKTYAFIGSSGVGKSTLVNTLLGLEGQESQARGQETQAVRSDHKGRHTTTSRELRCLPQGAILIDTPGMREFGVILDGDGLDDSFSDVLRWVSQCRFSDCGHQSEPGCAVQNALKSGELSQGRFQNYLQLQAEAAQAQARQERAAKKSNTKRRWKSITRNYKAQKKFRSGWD